MENILDKESCHLFRESTPTAETEAAAAATVAATSAVTTEP